MKYRYIALMFALALSVVSVISVAAYDHKAQEDFGPDCHAKTHDPHKAGGGTQIAVKAWTWCDTEVYWMDVSTSLYKYDGGLWTFKADDYVFDEYVPLIESNARWGTCANDTYDGISYHTAMADDGEYWTAGTSKAASVQTC